MMARTARPIEQALTEEQLRLGLRQLWRPGWPDDLATVLAHPTRGPLVRCMARQLSRQSATAGHATAVLRATLPVPPTPMQPPASRTARALPRMRFDAKRAAANDLGDD